MTTRTTEVRHTRQRGQVRAALFRTAGFRSAQQLHAQLSADGVHIGLTTVYRVLQLLVDAHEVDVMRLPTGERLYRHCRLSRHHHHLVCRYCGHTVEVVGLGVDVQAQRLAAAHGFTEVAHTVEILGTCATCANQARPGESEH